MKRHFLLAFLILFVGGCGFSPLYVQKTSAEDRWFFDGDFDNYIADQMALIKVIVQGEHLGQMVRTDLMDLLTPHGVPAKPKYVLYVNQVQEKEYDQALRRDITATRKRIDYQIDYYMTENSEKILSGNTVSYVSYDVLDNPYSTVMARKKVQRDAARMMANDIALRLGAFFNAKANEYEDAEQKALKQKAEESKNRDL